MGLVKIRAGVRATDDELGKTVLHSCAAFAEFPVSENRLLHDVHSAGSPHGAAGGLLWSRLCGNGKRSTTWKNPIRRPICSPRSSKLTPQASWTTLSSLVYVRNSAAPPGPPRQARPLPA